MTYDKNVRFEIRVLNVWRRDKKARKLIPSSQSVETFAFWVSTDDLRCNCPNLQIGSTYLILSGVRVEMFNGRPELMLTRKSIALPYQESWNRRLTKFRRRDKRGNCKKFSRKAKIRRNDQRKLRSYDTTKVRKKKTNSYNSRSREMSFQGYQQRHPAYNSYNPNYGYYGTRK